MLPIQWLPPIIRIVVAGAGCQESTSSMALLTTLLGFFGPIAGVAVGAIATYLSTKATLQNQLELQRTDIRAQTELKARELLFNAYQKRLDEGIKHLEDVGGNLGSLEAKLENLTTDEAKGKAIRPLIAAYGDELELYRTHVNRLEKELEGASLLAERKEVLSRIKEVLDLDFSTLTDAEVGRNYRRIMTLSGSISALEYDLLDKRAQDLFEPFIKKANG